MKKRLTDIVTAQNQADDAEATALKPEAIRLWLAEDKTKLTESFEAISAGECPMELDNSEASNSNAAMGKFKLDRFLLKIVGLL